MIGARPRSPVESDGASVVMLGPPGRVALLVWTIALVTLNPQARWLVVCGLAAVANLALYPRSWRGLLRWRWVLFGVLVIMPAGLWGGDPSLRLAGVALSADGLIAGARMLVRAFIVVIAVNGFAGAVDISEVAWLFERAGMRGLGFSLGIAVNLLPALGRSSRAAWQSLRMRGGLRAAWWRGLQLLLVTIVANALRRGEEIALAAEARAFSAENLPAAKTAAGRIDIYLATGLLAVLLAMLFLT